MINKNHLLYNLTVHNFVKFIFNEVNNHFIKVQSGVFESKVNAHFKEFRIKPYRIQYKYFIEQISTI